MSSNDPAVMRLDQAGDVQTRDTAGGDIHHYGDLPEGLRLFLGQEAEFRRLLLAALERQANEFRGEVSELRKESDIWRTTDESRRKARQEVDDRHKAWIAIAIAVLAIFVGMAVLVLAALVYDRLAIVAGLAGATLYALRSR
jgi:hypothetical protein